MESLLHSHHHHHLHHQRNGKLSALVDLVNAYALNWTLETFSWNYLSFFVHHFTHAELVRVGWAMFSCVTLCDGV